MANSIVLSPIFEIRFKRLKKKFPTLESEFNEFAMVLLKNPTMGTLITENVYKIRIASTDKNSGKSGGFRVITYVINKIENETEINMIIIYDKSEESSFNKNQIKTLIKNLDLI
ncbi:MAG TPA: addiction module toxin RelE [Flavobacterium sp.]|nr:addiction module toxin RelE [Flavobacterium sp.]HAT75348.1 addiction module toxin RelE [Flavobacterium sp.]